MKATLLVMNRAPYAGSLARAGLDAALAYAAFDQPTSVLFAGPGVLQLAPAQAPAAIGRKSLRRLIDSMPLYDLEAVYADGEALACHGLAADDLPAFVTVLDLAGQRDVQDRHEHVLSF
ncbi:MAG: DsrE family protein [Pseudohaliea sp.]